MRRAPASLADCDGRAGHRTTGSPWKWQTLRRCSFRLTNRNRTPGKPWNGHEANHARCKPCSVSQSVSSVKLFNSTTPVLFRLCCFACVASQVRDRSRSGSSDLCDHSHAFCDIRNIRSLFDTKVEHAIKSSVNSDRVFQTLQKALE